MKTPININERNQIFIPNALLKEESPIHKPEGEQFVSYLSSWMLEYPEEVKQKIGMEPRNGSLRSRGVGSKYGIFWMFCNNEIILWKYDSVQNVTHPKMQKKVILEDIIRCL